MCGERAQACKSGRCLTHQRERRQTAAAPLSPLRQTVGSPDQVTGIRTQAEKPCIAFLITVGVRGASRPSLHRTVIAIQHRILYYFERSVIAVDKQMKKHRCLVVILHKVGKTSCQA